MDFMNLPVGVLAVLVFLFRIVDVSLGTVRTLSVVHGRIPLAVFLGFIEVSIWVLAVGQVVTRLSDHPWLVLAFAGGFATGNAVGIRLERYLAMGSAVVRMITRRPADELERAVHSLTTGFTTFHGEGIDGPRTLVYASCPRRALPRLLEAARGVDPDLFYVVERFSELGGLGPLPHATGWRGVLKKK